MGVEAMGSPESLAKLTGTPSGHYQNTRKRSLVYLLELQTEMIVECQNPTEQARDKAACARVWKDLEELRLILTGYGRPKPVEARNSRSKRKSGPATCVMFDPTDGHDAEKDAGENHNP